MSDPLFFNSLVDYGLSFKHKMKDGEVAMMNKIESLDKQRMEFFDVPKKKKVFTVESSIMKSQNQEVKSPKKKSIKSP